MNFISDVVAAMRARGCSDEEVAAFVSAAVRILNEIELRRV